MTNIIKYEEQKKQLDYIKSLAKIASDSKQYANLSEANLLNLMLSAQDLGISPMKAINGGFYVVNGKVCMSTSLMADRVRKAGHSVKIIEMSKDKCIIIGVRKDNGDSLKLEYTWDDATSAGLTNSPTWKKYPKLMLYNRCMSTVARILFSDVLGSCYSEEERFDIQNIPPEKRPVEDIEESMTIEIVNPSSGEIMKASESEALTEEQVAKLDNLINEVADSEFIKKVVNHIDPAMESIYQIKSKDYERVIRSLEKRKAANDKTRVA